MDSSSCENTETDRKISNSHLFQVEQTEPLNLCLGGDLLNGFVMVETENENLTAKGDDDVIFVREYPHPVNDDKEVRRSNGQKSYSKATPRRNPVRQARISKRFKEEYADIDFDGDDFAKNTDEDNKDPLDIIECFDETSEDTDDWKIENVSKRNKVKKKVVGKKNLCKIGRRKKVTETDDETDEKVNVKEMESAIKSNLFLLKDYIGEIKTVNTLISEKTQQKSERTVNALNIFKQQVLLLSMVNGTDSDLLKWIKK